MVASNPDELREGHEVRTWKQRQEETQKKVKAITIFLTIALSAFMPIGRYCLAG